MALKPVGINDDGSFDGRARDWLNNTFVAYAPPPSGDTTGATDTAALNGLLATGAQVMLREAGESNPYIVTRAGGSGTDYALLLPVDGAKLIGTGKKRTWIKLADACADGVAVIKSTSGTAGVEVAHLAVDGNHARSAATAGTENEGINLKEPVDGSVHDVWVQNCAQDGIDIDGAEGGSYHNLDSHNNWGSGVHIAGTSGHADKTLVWAVNTSGNGQERKAVGGLTFFSGLNVVGSNVIVLSAVSYRDQRGFEFEGSRIDAAGLLAIESGDDSTGGDYGVSLNTLTHSNIRARVIGKGHANSVGVAITGNADNTFDLDVWVDAEACNDAAYVGSGPTDIRLRGSAFDCIQNGWRTISPGNVEAIGFVVGGSTPRAAWIEGPAKVLGGAYKSTTVGLDFRTTAAVDGVVTGAVVDSPIPLRDNAGGGGNLSGDITVLASSFSGGTSAISGVGHVFKGNAGLDDTIQAGIPSPINRPTTQNYYNGAHAPYDTTAGGLGLNADQLKLAPFYVPKSLQVNALAVNVLTAGTGGNVRLGIFESDSNGRPGALVTGTDVTVDATGTGGKAGTFTAVTLAAGVYWLGAVSQGASAQPKLQHLVGPMLGMAVSSGAAPTAPPAGWSVNGVTGALPSTLVGSSFGVSNSVPNVQARIV